MEAINLKIKRFKIYLLLASGYYLLSSVKQLCQVQLASSLKKAISEVITCVHHLEFGSLRLYPFQFSVFTHLKLIRKLKSIAFLALVLA